jgi:hypothetical protein
MVFDAQKIFLYFRKIRNITIATGVLLEIPKIIKQALDLLAGENNREIKN